MRNWGAMYDQSAPQKTVQNITTKVNPGTLPAHKFVCSRLSDRWQPLGFTVLSEPAAFPVAHSETSDSFYKLNQIVCVKADSSDTRQLFIMACLQENVSVGMKRRSFQSSAVHGRCREICRCEQQYCLCSNLIKVPRRYLRAWRRWSYPSPWCAAPYQWSCHYRRVSWDDRNGNWWSTVWAHSKEKKQAIWKRFFLL